MLLGEKMRELRKSKGLKLTQLATITGISISFLSDIENGRSKPSYENLEKIARALEAPISYFVRNVEDSSLSILNDDLAFIPILSLLEDFKDWNEDDKIELLHYLKAKKVIRNSND